MKSKIILMGLILTASLGGCQLSEFDQNYTNPATVSETSIEKQFAGFVLANRGYVLPGYGNYFVNLRITLNRFNLATGWVNTENQYVPGSAAINDRWNNYYGFLAQYRELERVYAGLNAQQQEDYRIFMVAAAVYFYDHTQKIVDLHGDIPWSKAGMLSTNGGNFGISYPEYDTAESIYTKMLDDLAGFADELRTLTVNPAIQIGFNTQDLINRGEVDMWVKYTNSLRLRMLSRVSGSAAFGARANTEIASILSNPSNYPIVASNNDNITFRIHQLGTLMDPNEFRNGLEDWQGNVAGGEIINHMKNNNDPRLSYLFEPGEEANGVYTGMDQLLNPSVQTELIGSGTLAVYNRSTLSRNQYFPGILMTAAQNHLLASEHYLKQNQNALAEAHYETAIRESIAYYEFLRDLSNDNTAPDPVVPTEESITAYLSAPEISFTNAADSESRMKLIARQKWLHFNVIQANENWAELRRVDILGLTHWQDESNQQSLPPNRWIYPGSEQTYNTENYAKVQSTDNLSTKVFWDID